MKIEKFEVTKEEILMVLVFVLILAGVNPVEIMELLK